MPRKNKPRNPLSFHVNADSGGKSEKRDVKCEKSGAKYPAIHFFFAFHAHFHEFRDKCLAGLK